MNIVYKITFLDRKENNNDMKNDYDSSVWISPQAYAKLIKGK